MVCGALLSRMWAGSRVEARGANIVTLALSTIMAVDKHYLRPTRRATLAGVQYVWDAEWLLWSW